MISQDLTKYSNITDMCNCGGFNMCDVFLSCHKLINDSRHETVWKFLPNLQLQFQFPLIDIDKDNLSFVLC